MMSKNISLIIASLQCDPSFPQHQYADWALTHGPVYTVMQGDTPQIIVNRAAEARDVFVKQGAYTQIRPPFCSIMLLRDGYFPSVMNGSKWQNARKMWQVVLSSRMVMVNGYRITSSSDPIVKETVEDLYDLSRVGFSGNMLDFWPFLERVVWTLPIYKVGRRMAKKHKDYIWKNYFGVKQRAEQGTRLPSFNRTIQERLQEGWTEVSELEGAEIGQHLLSGSTDTVVSTLTTCIAALCLFPDVQPKAQEEIDRVVGPDRLPRGEDEINLPYIQQLLLEPASFYLGAGRRFCPGKSLAEKSLFIAIARWLWAFNTSHATDEEGNKIPIDPKDLRPGNIVRIKRFSADVQPRNPQRAGVIRRVWREKCDTLLDENHQWKTNPERIAESMKMECDI
ncbi:cytochrome P450 [Coccidioides immitis RMSCC 3703]|uniref:Cytochrome P450 n=1 Tax=Coccidioides immitis RMSCC 3703 TaxID=454286 RepID=A0A0J8R4M1_COCIT|nr:cytochrome P450 [Coccidioides immitis RMSCC 3703]